MTYWVRAFCTDEEVPTLGMVLTWTASHGVDLTGEPTSPPWTPEERQGRPWESLGLWYRPDWTPLLVSINHVADPPALVADSLFASDVRRMREGGCPRLRRS